MRTGSRTFASCTLLLAALVAGCDKSTTGPARELAILLDQGGAQGANIGSILPVNPVVRVVDGDGRPVEGVRVDFAVSSGGGSITGATATTDANGRAALGSWTIGSVGENQVTANVSGLDPFVISAVGRCMAGTTIGLDESAAGNLSSTDCRFAGGEYTDRYTFATAIQRAVRFTQTSATVNSFLELQGPGNVVAFNNNTAQGVNNSGFKVLLAPGAYDLNPSTAEAGQPGPYTVATAAAPENESGCEIVFAVPGIETVQTLADTDCSDQGYRYDAIAVYLHTGRTYTISMNSPSFDTYLRLLTYAGGNVVEEHDDISATNTNARITYTPRFSGFYLITAEGATPTALGNYTLIIE